MVGATGSGKTTFVKLLARLADPSKGSITIGGIPLHQVQTESRYQSIQMVPQDGFLFNETIKDNVAFGRSGASHNDVEQAFGALGLQWWIDALPEGIDTHAGPRGERLSVGERQLVALARALSLIHI